MTPVVPIIPDTPIEPAYKVNNLWIIGLVSSLMIPVIFLVALLWFKRFRNRSASNQNSTVESISSERCASLPLLPPNNGPDERQSAIEMINLVEIISNVPDVDLEQSTSPKNLNPTSVEPNLEQGAFKKHDSPEPDPEPETVSSSSKEKLKIWPEIMLIPELEPKLTKLIVDNGFQFEAALLIQRCQIHLWASQKLHDSAFQSLADFGKTLIAVQANPTSENGTKHLKIINLFVSCAIKMEIKLGLRSVKKV